MSTDTTPTSRRELFYNAETGQVIERELTAEELANIPTEAPPTPLTGPE